LRKGKLTSRKISRSGRANLLAVLERPVEKKEKGCAERKKLAEEDREKLSNSSITNHQGEVHRVGGAQN